MAKDGLGLGGDANITGGVNLLIGIGISVFVLVLIVALVYGGYATENNSLRTTYGQFSTNAAVISNSVNAVNDIAANALTLALTGTTSWISTTSPLTIAITGNGIKTFSNGFGVNTATPNVIQTLTFTINSASITSLGTATTGNFYNITSVALSGVPGTAAPSITATVTQAFATNGLGGASSIVGNVFETVAQGTTFGAAQNFSTNGGQIPNTFATNSNLAVFALVFVAIITAVIVAIRGRKGKSGEGGILS